MSNHMEKISSALDATAERPRLDSEFRRYPSSVILLCDTIMDLYSTLPLFLTLAKCERGGN